jgi:hypothetical protein
MLTVETIGRIRREHFFKGKTIKEIARDLRVSRNTVRKVLRSGETSFEYEREVQPRPKLGRWTDELDALLAGNATKPARKQLTLIRLFEDLRGRGGVDIAEHWARTASAGYANWCLGYKGCGLLSGPYSTTLNITPSFVAANRIPHDHLTTTARQVSSARRTVSPPRREMV